MDIVFRLAVMEVWSVENSKTIKSRDSLTLSSKIMMNMTVNGKAAKAMALEYSRMLQLIGLKKQYLMVLKL